MQIITVKIEDNVEENCNKITNFERLGYVFAITLNLALGFIFTILD
jgi:hypothetical protein